MEIAFRKRTNTNRMQTSAPEAIASDLPDLISLFSSQTE